MQTAVVTDERTVLPDFVLGQPLVPVPVPLGELPAGGRTAAGVVAICAVTGLLLWYTFGRRPR
jgi:hypothetical protein